MDAVAPIWAISELAKLRRRLAGGKDSKLDYQIQSWIRKIYLVGSSSSFLRLASRFSTVFGSYCSQVVPKFFTSRLLRELHSRTAGLTSNICLYTRVLALPIMESEGGTLERRPKTKREGLKSRVLNSQRKKYPSPIKKSAKRRAMALATAGSKLVQNEPNQPGFYTRLPARLRVLLMRQHGKSYRQIARQVGIDKATVQKIVHSAPEKEPVEKIFKDAEILRFASVAGQALEALHMRLRQNDAKVALAVLQGLGFLKP